MNQDKIMKLLRRAWDERPPRLLGKQAPADERSHALPGDVLATLVRLAREEALLECRNEAAAVAYGRSDGLAWPVVDHGANEVRHRIESLLERNNG